MRGGVPPEFVKRPGALQLPDGKVLTFPAPKEGEIRKVYAYGHMYECDHLGNFRNVTRRQLFKTAFEANFLGLAVADKPFIPASLKGLDQEDVKKMLLKPYEPKGDETEEETEQVRAYDAMRATALQFMEESGAFDDFVDYFANRYPFIQPMNMARMQKMWKRFGVKKEHRIPYRVAVQEGWAAQPTNEYQRAVWDEVRHIPEKPIRIEFDPKKGK